LFFSKKSERYGFCKIPLLTKYKATCQRHFHQERGELFQIGNEPILFSIILARIYPHYAEISQYRSSIPAQKIEQAE
jgi:hypothetical protein